MLLLDAQLSPAERHALGYQGPADAVWDSRGRGLRTTPCRRTLAHDLPGLGRVFRKHRRGRLRDLRREWRVLAQLAELGIRVPQRLFLARRGADSVIGMRDIGGRAMDGLLAAGDPRAMAMARTKMPELCARLHGAGWMFRDMYWNHVYLTGEGLGLIDVERAFRPRWRRRRWLVKDLAGLWASTPTEHAGVREGLRFLRRYAPELSWPERRRLARDVAGKAARIRGHRTRYPG